MATQGFAGIAGGASPRFVGRQQVMSGSDDFDLFLLDTTFVRVQPNLRTSIKAPTVVNTADGWWSLSSSGAQKFDLNFPASWCGPYEWFDVAHAADGDYLVGQIDAGESSRVCLPDGGVIDQPGVPWGSIYVTTSGTIFVGTEGGDIVQLGSTVDGGVVAQVIPYTGYYPYLEGVGEQVWITGTCSGEFGPFSPIYVRLEDAGVLKFSSVACANALTMLSAGEVVIGDFYNHRPLQWVRLDGGLSPVGTNLDVGRMYATPDRLYVTGRVTSHAEVFRRRGH
jgi:hypothetical protein